VNDGKFEAFGGMKRHQCQDVRPLVPLIEIGDKLNRLEKQLQGRQPRTGYRRLRAITRQSENPGTVSSSALNKIVDHAEELLDIPDPRFRLGCVLGFKFRDVA
jgi:hypothetical protein